MVAFGMAMTAREVRGFQKQIARTGKTKSLATKRVTCDRSGSLGKRDGQALRYGNAN